MRKSTSFGVQKVVSLVATARNHRQPSSPKKRAEKGTLTKSKAALNARVSSRHQAPEKEALALRRRTVRVYLPHTV